jgi:hypothetical protein
LGSSWKKLAASSTIRAARDQMKMTTNHLARNNCFVSLQLLA